MLKMVWFTYCVLTIKGNLLLGIVNWSGVACNLVQGHLTKKYCNFEPFCYVIKSVLIKREEEKTLF